MDNIQAVYFFSVVLSWFVDKLQILKFKQAIEKVWTKEVILAVSPT